MSSFQSEFLPKAGDRRLQASCRIVVGAGGACGEVLPRSTGPVLTAAILSPRLTRRLRNTRRTLPCRQIVHQRDRDLASGRRRRARRAPARSRQPNRREFLHAVRLCRSKLLPQGHAALLQTAEKAGVDQRRRTTVKVNGTQAGMVRRVVARSRRRLASGLDCSGSRSNRTRRHARKRFDPPDQALVERGANVAAFDPVAPPGGAVLEGIEFAADAYLRLRVDALVIVTELDSSGR